MQHAIPHGALGAHGRDASHAVSTCVHCGFCLPACPTYSVLGEEMDSPRGRILLMKEVLEGHLEWNEAMPHIDRCLGCLACVTACPSGVEYEALLTPFRDEANRQRTRPWLERLRRRMTLDVLSHPRRLSAAMAVGRRVKPYRSLLPAMLRPMVDLLPGRPERAMPLPARLAANGSPRARVALLTGCAQQVLAPNIAWAAARVLVRAGVEVVVPAGQRCCGALALHCGDFERARQTARINLRAFPDDVDAVVTTAAGCGSGMQNYGMLFEGCPEEARARHLAASVIDVSAFLVDAGLPEIPALPAAITVAYHHACHLAHGQNVTTAPIALLRRIPNLTLVEIPDQGHCCGSAGTYNIDQPDIAAELGTRKAAAILTTRAHAVVTGNIGCMMQIRAHLHEASGVAPDDHPSRDVRTPEVLHTIELIDRAMQHHGAGDDPGGVRSPQTG